MSSFTPQEEEILDITERTDEINVILDKIKKSFSFAALIAGSKVGSTLLNKEEILMLIDPSIVDWDKFHTDYIESIAMYRASSSDTARHSTIRHQDYVEKLVKTIKGKIPPSIASGGEMKVIGWKAGIEMIAPEIQREMNHSIFHGARDLHKDVLDILKSNWEPIDDEHAATIYYITGAMLRVVENLKKKKHGHPFLQHFLDKATTTKDQAKSSSLPCERVATTEHHQLFYANEQFYDVMVRIESVFDYLLNVDNFAKYGIDLTDQLKDMLVKMDIGFRQFMPTDTPEDSVMVVTNRILNAYVHMRGKDYTTKQNAQRGYNYHETHRANIGVKAQLARDKRRENDGKLKSNRTTNDNEASAYEKMKNTELKKLLRDRNLKVGGNKEKLISRLLASEQSSVSKDNSNNNIPTENADDMESAILAETDIMANDLEEYDLPDTDDNETTNNKSNGKSEEDTIMHEAADEIASIDWEERNAIMKNQVDTTTETAHHDCVGKH